MPVSKGFWELFFDFLTNIFNSQQAGAGATSILLIVSGLSLVRRAKSDNPFAPFVLPILGLTFILPCIIFCAIILKPPSDVIMGIIGTIAGYVFGSLQNARTQRSLGLPATTPAQGQPNMSEEKDTLSSDFEANSYAYIEMYDTMA